MIAFLLVISACGGSDSSDDTGGSDSGDDTAPTGVSDSTTAVSNGAVASDRGPPTFASDDGVVAVEIPQGVASDGIVVTVTPLAAEDLPAELQGVDPSALVLAYDLGPDGSTFAEPVSITFRIDPIEHRLDLEEGALPVLVMVTTDSAGQVELVDGVEVSREGSVVVVGAEVRHFSPVVVALKTEGYLRISPRRLDLNVDQSEPVTVVIRSDAGDDSEKEVASVDAAEPWDWAAVSPFSIASTTSVAAEVKCDAPSDGEVQHAYSVRVPVSSLDADAIKLFNAV